MTEVLKVVGYYSDTASGDPANPKLSSERGKFTGSTAEIVAYLKAAHVLAVSGSAAYDELDAAKPFLCTDGVQTDGVWMWPISYAYYVEKYQVAVPEELLELARSRNWVPPVFSDEEDFEDRIPFAD
ncbi:hypothetical protein [Streptomyces sp. NBC_00687]|uniref:hypothetical protein n=1 Tax=Streptomyces sp. NBC_00687 TaxID=2975807 RepID=UPI0022595FEF|nr:hypothetical protein [Streptomyces sp. NBC_00687]MCX4919893.1 hypothetical protein [Streptomyces sp. NBC_00687]